MLFKIQHKLVDINSEFVQPGDNRTRGSQHLRQLEANKDVYRYSFYPRTISDWNSNNQRLELASHISHRQPDSTGIQGSRRLPANHTPLPLDPLQLYIGLTRDVENLICFYWASQFLHRVTQKIYTLTTEEKSND